MSQYMRVLITLVWELHPSGSQAGICRKVFFCKGDDPDLHGAAFSHPTNRPSLSSSREALQKEEAKPSTMPSARRRCKMKNQKALLSPALHTTTFCALSSTITQDLDLHIIFIDHPVGNPTPIFFPTPTPSSSNSISSSSNHHSQLDKQ